MRLSNVILFVICLLLPAAQAYVNYTELTCVGCAAGFWLDGDAGVCRRCPANSTSLYHANASEPTDCICDAGFFNGPERCERCAVGTYKPTVGNATCAACAAHETTAGEASLVEQQCVCVAGFFYNGNACQRCLPGSFKGEIGDHACAECPAGSFCPEGATAPVACQSTSTSAAGSGTLRACLCPAGSFHEYLPAGAADVDLTALECHPCAAGTYNPVVDAAECLLCPSDTFYERTGAVNATQCESCPEHASADPGSTARTQCLCALGYSGAPGETCVPCAPGSYRSDPDSYVCVYCSADTYNVQHASSSEGDCRPCDPGTSAPEGSSRELQCVCDPGSFATVQRRDVAPFNLYFECEACRSGTYQPAPNRSACVGCPAGTASAAVGADTADVCVGCVDGFVALGEGNAACVPCAVNTWQDLTNAGRAGSACEPCTGNSSHAQTAVTDARTCHCADGFYAVDAVIGQDESGADVYARTCAECPPGYFCPGDDAAHACPYNAWSPGGVFPGPCVPCAANSLAISRIISSPAQCQCVAGAEGTYDSACALCQPGHFQPDDLTQAGQAAAGTQATATACRPCAVGSYAEAHGTVQCSACAGNSTSAAGADEREDCLCNARFFGPNGGPCAPCVRNSYCPGGELGEQALACHAHSAAPPLSDEATDCRCIAGFYSATGSPLVCHKCVPGSYCGGDTSVEGCPGNSTTRAGAGSVEQCICLPGMWRGCVDTPSGAQDADGNPCVVPWTQPCRPCGADIVCVNNTLMHCTEFSSAPPRTHSPDACVCDDGYFDSKLPLINIR